MKSLSDLLEEKKANDKTEYSKIVAELDKATNIAQIKAVIKSILIYLMK